METAYYYQYQPAASSSFTDFSSTWPVSAAGQAAFAKDLIAELKKHTNVNALYWWFPEENGNGPNKKVLTDWVNRGLWNNSSHKAHAGLYALKNYLDNESAGVETVTRSVSNGRWYSLQGVQLDTRPQRRGLYIHDRKKIFVK